MEKVTEQKDSTPRTVIHFPESWLRLVNVIKHQASAGKFIFIEGQHQSGKTTFAETLLKKLSIVDDISVSYQKLHPLSSTPQILSNISESAGRLSIVILDDVDEVAAEVLEELITNNDDVYFVILAEPDLINRIPRLQNSRFNLPLFNKEDCLKLLRKMYHLEDPNIEVTVLDSELVYYESRGYPAEVVKVGQGLKDKLSRKSSGINSFDIVNKGIFSTSVLVIGFIIFLAYLFWPSADEKIEKDSIQISEAQVLPIEKDNGAGEVLPDLNTGELVISGQETKPLTFQQWLEQQNPEHYTIQLYSNDVKAEAEKFQQSLDLADSFVYPVKIDSKLAYRVVWGVYPNRARAQLAVQSLPKDILQQKPWLRSFDAISNELNPSR